MQGTKLQRRIKLSARYAVEMRYSSAGGFHVEWEPHVPSYGELGKKPSWPDIGAVAMRCWPKWLNTFGGAVIVVEA